MILRIIHQNRGLSLAAATSLICLVVSRIALWGQELEQANYTDAVTYAFTLISVLGVAFLACLKRYATYWQERPLLFSRVTAVGFSLVGVLGLISLLEGLISDEGGIWPVLAIWSVSMLISGALAYDEGT